MTKNTSSSYKKSESKSSVTRCCQGLRGTYGQHCILCLRITESFIYERTSSLSTDPAGPGLSPLGVPVFDERVSPLVGLLEVRDEATQIHHVAEPATISLVDHLHV